MSSSAVEARNTDNLSLPQRIVYALRRSFLLSLATLGGLLIAMGYSLELLWRLGYPLEDGIVAGMLGIWGATVLLIGSVGYGSLQYMREY